MYRYFLPLLLFLFVGCADLSTTAALQKKELPVWVHAPSANQAVGSSEVNFQGVHTQREEALNIARSQLSQNIESYITSSLKKSSKISANAVSDKMREEISALSRVFLHEARQVDAFFDETSKLYVLVEVPKERIERVLGVSSLNAGHSAPLEPLEPFDKEALWKSGCYPKAALEDIDTKSRLFQGRPLWFFRPSFGSAVGIAEQQEGMSLSQQKEAALTLAKSSLIKSQKLSVTSQDELLKIAREGMFAQILDTSTLTRSQERIFDIEINDMWLDPKSCELYILVVQKGQSR